MLGHLKTVLTQALNRLTPVRRPDWLHQVNDFRKKHPLPIPVDDREIKPQSLIKAIDEISRGRTPEEDAIIVTDVGQHQMWAAQLIVSRKPRRFLSSGGLGTMGYGLPAALGAQLGRPDLPVVLICGDGGFQMNIQELATVREHNLPIKMVIVNNNCLGMVRQWQQFFFQKRYSATLWGFMPDFVQIAKGYDIPGRSVSDPGQMRAALSEMMAAPGPYLLEFKVSFEENVLPMIPAGGGLTDFYGE